MDIALGTLVFLASLTLIATVAFMAVTLVFATLEDMLDYWRDRLDRLRLRGRRGQGGRGSW